MGGGRRALSAPRDNCCARGSDRHSFLTGPIVFSAAVAIAVSVLVWAGLTTATAQDSSRGILGRGDAVVTGFSGARPPAAALPAQVDALDKTLIDIDGPSLRVIDLNNPGGPPRGQVMTAPKPFTVRAQQIGQVFAVTHDDATPPNIYVAATSGYGLPIVAAQPDADGTLRRLRRGEPGARFMPGLFGGAAASGGPGSIWKIDGHTGAVSLFANIPNSGAGMGDIAFDFPHRQFFVSDRSSGLIYRVGLDGALRGTFDHGTAGRGAVGLTPVPDQTQSRLDIQSPAFDPGNPQSWNYPAPARRTFGLAVWQLRLFYALAEGPQIWSVALNPDGSFGSNVTWELSVPAGPKPSEIASILFDAGGQIYLAERGAPTGAYDFMALAEFGESRVLRFRPKRPGDPPGVGNWYPVSEEYALGFPPNFRNGNGGVAIGYGYDAGGIINRNACGGTLWSTGEQLRNERTLVERLQRGGPLIVDGLQANSIDLVRPRNVPPFESYYVDYDDRFDGAAARGHLGDVDIWQMCQAVALAPPPAMAPAPTPLLAPQFPVTSAPPAETGECRRGEIQICCRAGASEPNGLAVSCAPPPPGTNVCPGNATKVCCTPNANGVCVPRPPPPPPSTPPPGGKPPPVPPPSGGKPFPVPPPSGGKPFPVSPPSGGKPPPFSGIKPLPLPPPSDGEPRQIPAAPDVPEVPGNLPPANQRARTPPATPVPSGTPTATEDMCSAWGWVPFVGFICQPDRTCHSDNDCPTSTICRQGACIIPSQSAAPASVPAPSEGCQRPSILVNGACCSPETVAAGVCGAVSPPPPPQSNGCPVGLFPSTNGKTCCTREEITNETCGVPPAPKKKLRKKRAEKPAPVPDSAPQINPGFSIQIGPGGGFPGGGGSRRGGGGGRGGGPKPSVPN